MKKNYFILLSILFLYLNLTAQKNQYIPQKADAKLKLSNAKVQKTSASNTNRNITMPGDTLWSEDFNNGFPTDWTMTDNTGIGGWVVTDTIYTAAWTSSSFELTTHEADNGLYMHLPADYHNCETDVWPPVMVADPLVLDAQFETDWIDISSALGGVVLSFYTTFRLCCSPADSKLDVNISTDGSNWTTFNGRVIDGGLYPFGDVAGGSGVVCLWNQNIGSITAGASQIKIQFRFHGSSHYHWSIDDLTITEASPNSVEILDTYSSKQIYTQGVYGFEDYNTRYSKVPANIKYQPQLGALIKQEGSEGVNVRMAFEIDSAGTHIWPDTPPAYSTTSIPSYTYQMNDSVLVSDTTGNNAHLFYNPELSPIDFNNWNMMDTGIPYNIIYSVESDNPNYANSTFESYPFHQTLGLYSYHWQPRKDSLVQINNDIGPFSYSSPQGVTGDLLVNKFTFEQDANETFKIYGVRIFVPESENVTFDISGNGVTIEPVLYYFDKTANSGNGDWAEVVELYGAPHTIVEQELEHYILLTFDEMEVNNYQFPQGDYLVGIRVNDYNGQKIAIAVDDSYSQGDAHFYMKISPWQDTWYYFEANGSAMIDVYTNENEVANFDFAPVNVHQATQKQNIKVYPNPTTGILKIENIEQANIKIYALTGQLLFNTNVNSKQAQIDLSHLKKGSYLIQIIEQNKITTKKIHLTH